MNAPPHIRFCGPLALVCLVSTGCREGNEFVAPPPPDVTVQQPIVKEVTTYMEFTGRAEAVDTVEVRARVKGFLNSVDFEPGQTVRAGDPDDPEDPGDLLFTIEAAPFEAAVSAAEAAFAQQEAARGLAEVTRDKTKRAFDLNAANDLELRDTEAKLEAAIAAVDAAEAALETARIDLSYTKMYAPISGRISRELVDAGNLVGAGEATLLTTVVQDDPVYAYFDISERDVVDYLERGRPRDRPEQERTRAVLKLVNGATYEHEGIVDFAESRVDSATGTLQIRATFPNPDGKLYPGLFVRILIPDATGEQQLIPEVAILRDLAGAYVLVADDKNLVQRRDIQLGALVQTDRIVTKGLDPADRLIINGIQRAIPGNPVNPQLADRAAASDATPPPADEQTSEPDTDDSNTD